MARTWHIGLAAALLASCGGEGGAGPMDGGSGPADWALAALASEGACEESSDCVTYRHDCLPSEVHEHSSCAVALPSDFDTAELDAVMQRIRDTGLSPWEGGCGMCTLELPPDPTCLAGKCAFPSRE